MLESPEFFNENSGLFLSQFAVLVTITPTCQFPLC